MRAAVVEAFKEPLTVWNDWPDPEVGPDDVLVKVEANGICRSDWHLWQGNWDWVGFSPPLPAVLGHESSGTVEEVGANVRRFQKGDRVVFPFGQACGSCPTCAEGRQNVCENLSMSMFRGAGGFGEFSIVSYGEVNLVGLPDNISFVDAAGLAAVDIASAIGANVIAVTRSEEKLAKARELGAVHTIAASDDTAQEIQELTGGGAHVSADCLGTEATWMPSIMALRSGGRLVRIGMTGADERGVLPLPADLIVAKEVTIVGSMGMQARCYPEMLRMVETGSITPSALVTETVSMDGVSDVLEAMSGYKTLGYSVITN